MTLPAPIPGGLLAKLHDHWGARLWDLEDLDRFRMEADDTAVLDDLSEDDRTALESLSADDVKALGALSAEQLAELADGNGEDPRIRQARDEAVKRRRELKPWKDLGKEFGMTPEQIREALAKGKPPKADPDDKNKPPALDADEIRRKASLDAEAKANRKVVRAEVKVLARDLFAAPDDAPLYVDLDEYDVDDDGELVDSAALIEDLKKVLKDRPHLAKKPGKPKPDKGQGQRGTPASGAEAGRAEAQKRFGKPAESK